MELSSICSIFPPECYRMDDMNEVKLRARIATSLLLIFIIFSPATALADDLDTEAAVKIAKQLKESEFYLPFGSGSSEAARKDIALLDLQLEEMRTRYARQIYLNALGIAPALQLQITRCAYERVQVQLAGKVNRIRDIPARLVKQRAIANASQKEIAAARGKHEIYSGSPLKKPAPAKHPGAAPSH